MKHGTKADRVEFKAASRLGVRRNLSSSRTTRGRADVSSKSSETSLLGESGRGLGNLGEWTFQEAECLCYAELVQWII